MVWNSSLYRSPMSRGFKSQLEKKLSQASSLKTQSLQQASFIVAIFYTCNRVLELAPCRQSFHFQQLDFLGKSCVMASNLSTLFRDQHYLTKNCWKFSSKKKLIDLTGSNLTSPTIKKIVKIKFADNFFLLLFRPENHRPLWNFHQKEVRSCSVIFSKGSIAILITIVSFPSRTSEL